MHTRALRRATALAAAVLLAIVGIAHADTILADGDTVRPSAQGLVDLGTLPAGSTRVVEVGFVLECRNMSHPAPGTVIALTPTNPSPVGGAIAATPASIGPVPADWPAAGVPCLNDELFEGTDRSTVTIVAPAVGGTHTFRIEYAPSPATGLTNVTAISFRFTVAANQPPSISVPADFSVEGDTLGGWAAAWTVGASDPEDGALDATCSPAAGTVLPVGVTTVTCSAVDAAGAEASASFEVEVTDGTGPRLGDLPANLVREAVDEAGTPVSWPDPSATDVVDGSLPVTCLPASGSTFAIGPTEVTCSATDRAGNATSASFQVTVTAVPVPVPAEVSVQWGEPVGSQSTMVVNGSRTVPLKADVFVAGHRVEPGSAAAPRLVLERLATCGGATVERRDGGELRWDGRWRAQLDTSTLGPGCWRVSVAVGDEAGGGFELSIPGSAEASASTTSTMSTATSPSGGKGQGKAKGKGG